MMMYKHDKIYTKLINCTRWRKLRNAMLTQKPFCEQCNAVGRLRAATEVHHIIPIESKHTLTDMESLAYDVNNLQCLCHDCHVAIHVAMHSKSKASVKARAKDEVQSFMECVMGGDFLK